MPHYASSDDLRRMLLESRSQGQPTPELIGTVSTMIDGLYNRYRFRGVDVDDVQQDAYFKLLAMIRSAKLNDDRLSVFCYVSQILFNLMRQHYREQRDRHGRNERLAEMLTPDRPQAFYFRK